MNNKCPFCGGGQLLLGRLEITQDTQVFRVIPRMLYCLNCGATAENGEWKRLTLTPNPDGSYAMEYEKPDKQKTPGD